MKRQRNTINMQEQTQNTKVQINQEEIGKLPEKDFRVMTVKMIQNLRNRMEIKVKEMHEMFNKDLEELLFSSSTTTTTTPQ